MKWTDTVVHFRIASHFYGDKTLCGADYKEPSAKAAKDGKVCNECIHVMWNEQHRRNTLLPRMRKMKLKTTPEQKEKVVQHQLKKLFLKDWRKYNA